MVSFVFYDLTFLVLFAIFVSIFLHRGKKNIKKEGLLILYKTSWGIKLIDYVGTKYKRTLKFLSYVSIGLGYVLMAGIIYLFYSIIKIYMFNQDVVRAVKVPPIMPLIPYLPEIFKIDFLPPFYFTYWIIILAVIAIPHEFAHGIFARRYKIGIKSTGFGFFPYFLPVFLAAFVEQDEKDMEKSSKFHQMAVLSAGTFANILTAILFFGILFLFFSVAYSPSGIQFDTYSVAVVGMSNITSVNGVNLVSGNYSEIVGLLDEDLNEIEAGGSKFVANENSLINQEKQNSELFQQGYLILYNDAPAVRNNLSGVILEIDNEKTDSLEKFRDVMDNYSPGETVLIKTLGVEGVEEKEIVLAGNPLKPEEAFLGIGFYNQQRSGIMGNVYNLLSSFRDPHTYYEPTLGDMSKFIYDLLWWLILICISVALINMVPVGIFDGGRFFYLTVLSITKSDKIAKSAFVFMTYLFLFIVFGLMALWVYSFF